MCGLSKRSVIKIGNTISNKIKNRLKRIDKINKNEKIPNKIKKKNEKICNKMTKRIALKLRFYEYHQRLAYKCKLNKTGLKVIDERYTSKICSKCGWSNDKLGGNKTFNCEECGIKIDRDVNGCRGIYIKQWFGK